MSAREYFDVQYEVVDLGTEASTPEASALRVVLLRLREDLYALQAAIVRVTDERNYWREAYHRNLVAQNTKTGKLQ